MSLSERVYSHNFNSKSTDAVRPPGLAITFELQHHYDNRSKRIINFFAQEFRDMIGKCVSLNGIYPGCLCVNFAISSDTDAYGNDIDDLIKYSFRFHRMMEKYSISRIWLRKNPMADVQSFFVRADGVPTLKNEDTNIPSFV